MQEFSLSLYTENSDTILHRVIETVKRRRIPIRALHAAVCPGDETSGTIEIRLIADSEAKRLLKAQLEKLVEVIEVIE
jgi:acetolactate synthase regulatory subunit